MDLGLRDGAKIELQRTSRACGSCRRKKIRCSGTKPSCANCFKYRLSCVYETGDKSLRKSPISVPDIEGLLPAKDVERKLENMESAVLSMSDRFVQMLEWQDSISERLDRISEKLDLDREKISTSIGYYGPKKLRYLVTEMAFYENSEFKEKESLRDFLVMFQDNLSLNMFGDAKKMDLGKYFGFLFDEFEATKDEFDVFLLGLHGNLRRFSEKFETYNTFLFKEKKAVLFILRYLLNDGKNSMCVFLSHLFHSVACQVVDKFAEADSAESLEFLDWEFLMLHSCMLLGIFKLDVKTPMIHSFAKAQNITPVDAIDPNTQCNITDELLKSLQVACLRSAFSYFHASLDTEPDIGQLNALLAFGFALMPTNYSRCNFFVFAILYEKCKQAQIDTFHLGSYEDAAIQSFIPVRCLWYRSYMSFMHMYGSSGASRADPNYHQTFEHEMYLLLRFELSHAKQNYGFDPASELQKMSKVSIDENNCLIGRSQFQDVANKFAQISELGVCAFIAWLEIGLLRELTKHEKNFLILKTSLDSEHLSHFCEQVARFNKDMRAWSDELPANIRGTRDMDLSMYKKPVDTPSIVSDYSEGSEILFNGYRVSQVASQLCDQYQYIGVILFFKFRFHSDTVHANRAAAVICWYLIENPELSLWPREKLVRIYDEFRYKAVESATSILELAQYTAKHRLNVVYHLVNNVATAYTTLVVFHMMYVSFNRSNESLVAHTIPELHFLIDWTIDTFATLHYCAHSNVASFRYILSRYLRKALAHFSWCTQGKYDNDEKFRMFFEVSSTFARMDSDFNVDCVAEYEDKVPRTLNPDIFERYRSASTGLVIEQASAL